MTDDDKALVENLRDMPVWPMEEAADRIEAQAARLAEADALIELQNQDIGRLREALGWFLNDSRFVVQVGGNPNVVPQMIEAARARLGDDND